MKKILLIIGLLFVNLFTSKAQVYCTETFSIGSTDGDYIANFTLGSINQTGTGSSTPFYTYFNTSTTNLVLNQTYSYSLTSGTFTNDRYSVFIDFNHDGDFLDTDELIDTLSSTVASQVLTANFVVPSSAALGSTRLRIICTYDVWPTTCDTTLDYGETQDYNVNILSTNTFAPVAAFAASTTTISTTQTVSYTDLSANLPTSWNWTFSGASPATSSQQNPTGISYANPGTYTVSLTVSNANGNNTATYTNYINVILAPTCFTALNPQCDTATLEYISLVSITGTNLNNTTSCSDVSSNYSNFTADNNLVPTLFVGNNYELKVSCATTSIVSCWIDYNHNFDLEASEWIQVDTASVADSASTVSISIPATALLGKTIMRIRSRDAGSANGATDACTPFFSGETEDYLLNIRDYSGIEQLLTQQNVQLYPSPVIDQLTIELGNNKTIDATIEIIDLTGKKVSQLLNGAIQANYKSSFDVSRLQAGLYFVRISSIEGSIIKKFTIE